MFLMLTRFIFGNDHFSFCCCCLYNKKKSAQNVALENILHKRNPCEKWKDLTTFPVFPSSHTGSWRPPASSAWAGLKIRLWGLDWVEQWGWNHEKLFLGTEMGLTVSLGGHTEKPCQPGHTGQHSCLLTQWILKSHWGQSLFHIPAFNSEWPLQELSLKDAE